MVVHIPHSSKLMVPDESLMVISKEELEKELNNMTDHKTDILFAHKNVVVFPYSRLWVDVERFVDDEMKGIGMGVCYTRTSYGKQLYKDFNLFRSDRMELYYNHHAELTRRVGEELKRYGKCLIIDAHSFPKDPLPYEKDHNRPDICIGTNAWDLEVGKYADFAESYFRERGYWVLRNSPFWGSIVPEKYKDDKNVSSMMIEVNRGLYMEGDFEKIRKEIQQLLDELERLVV